METLPRVLALNISGMPDKWLNYEDTACYYAKGLVAWDMAPITFDLHGGINAKTGKQSILTINTIIAVKGKITERRLKKTQYVPLENRALFGRDRHVCAYCGHKMSESLLTRDHIKPKAQGGLDLWMNVVTACKSCNQYKDRRTPEEAGMQLIYVPYVPNKSEWLILKNRRILVDQMDFLMQSVPKHSRLHEN